MITERDIAVLRVLILYYVLTRTQIQRLCFPGTEARVVRRLQLLYDHRLIDRTHMQVVNPAMGAAAPVYFPAPLGCEFLAGLDKDDRHLTTPTQTPQSHHLYHWIAVSETHMALVEAVESQTDVAIDGWLSEWDVANKDETQPEKRFRLYTLLRDNPRLVCAPDAAFLLGARGQRLVFYLEQDRNTSGVKQIAAAKTPGYAAMVEKQLHRRHFPETTLDSFRVLMVAPTARRRDLLRREIAEKAGSQLWRFVARGDLTPEKLLTEPIVYTCDPSADPSPLVKPALATAGRGA